MMNEIYAREIEAIKNELKDKTGITIIIVDKLDELIRELEELPQGREIATYWEAQRQKVDAQKTAYCEMLTQLGNCRKPEEYPIQ